MTDTTTETLSYNELTSIDEIDANIKELIVLINVLKDYHNPYRYLQLPYKNANGFTNIMPIELTPDILNYHNEAIQSSFNSQSMTSILRHEIQSKYSMLDYSKKYKLTMDIPIETKINIIYAESLSNIRHYCDNVLPEKYILIFKENNYNNIYEKVKTELLKKVNALFIQKIKILSNVLP